MAIALKEARETRYWLRLIRESSGADVGSLDILIKEASELANILEAIVSKARKSLRA